MTTFTTGTGGPAEVDHTWLRRTLGWRIDDEDAIVIRSISLSGGAMGSVHRVQCKDRSAILKGPPDVTTTWGSHAADHQLIDREVAAYRYLRGLGPGAPRVAPRCYWSATAAVGGGGLALEDLGPQPAVVPRMAAGLARPQAFAAVRCLALLHTASLTERADPFAAAHPWLYTGDSPELVAAVRLGLADLSPTMARCWPAVPTPDLVGVDLEGVLIDAQRRASITAVCHGDAWSANVLFQPDAEASDGNSAYLIDWQFAMWGNPLTDVALLLWSSLDVGDRRAWLDDLLRHYHQTLTAHTTVNYPAAACRDDYAVAEPYAVLVALATVETYVAGMNADDLHQFEPRLLTLLNRLSGT